MSLYFLDHPTPIEKSLIGGKGYFCHQNAQTGENVPKAAILSTDTWKEYQKNPEKTLQKLKKEWLPTIMDQLKSKDGTLPLVSVRSSGAVSMPGMMDTILNVGITLKWLKEQGVDFEQAMQSPAESKPKKGAKKTQHQQQQAWVMDVYTRFLQMYGETVCNIPHADLVVPTASKTGIAALTAFFTQQYQKHQQPLPSLKWEDQVMACVAAVWKSWDNERAVLYRQLNNIDPKAGTAVVIQQMVYGNKNEHSATGVLFSRDPNTGMDVVTGEYLTQAQGEDVVSGRFTPKSFTLMREEFPQAHQELVEMAKRLEQRHHDIQDIEFTIEDGTVYLLQSRAAKCSPLAKLRTLLGKHRANEIDAETVLTKINKSEYLALNTKQVDPGFSEPHDGKGLPAATGVMQGRVVFGPSQKYTDPTIFVAQETTPDDLDAFQLSQGVLTASGGATSHAAVVARSMGKTAVVGCANLKVVTEKGEPHAVLNGKTLRSGDWITMDANEGRIWVGKEVPIIQGNNNPLFIELEDLVMNVHPEWTRLTSDIADLEQGRPTYFLSYRLDSVDDATLDNDLNDIFEFLTGTFDLTGSMDYLNEQHPKLFMFAETQAKDQFLRKMNAILDWADNNNARAVECQLYLGKYEQEYAHEFKKYGFRIRPQEQVRTTPGKKEEEWVQLCQQYTKDIPEQRVVISPRNALLGVLK